MPCSPAPLSSTIFAHSHHPSHYMIINSNSPIPHPRMKHSTVSCNENPLIGREKQQTSPEVTTCSDQPPLQVFLQHPPPPPLFSRNFFFFVRYPTKIKKLSNSEHKQTQKLFHFSQRNIRERRTWVLALALVLAIVIVAQAANVPLAE